MVLQTYPPGGGHRILWMAKYCRDHSVCPHSTLVCHEQVGDSISPEPSVGLGKRESAEPMDAWDLERLNTESSQRSHGIQTQASNEGGEPISRGVTSLIPGIVQQWSHRGRNASGGIEEGKEMDNEEEGGGQFDVNEGAMVTKERKGRARRLSDWMKHAFIPSSRKSSKESVEEGVPRDKEALRKPSFSIFSKLTMSKSKRCGLGFSNEVPGRSYSLWAGH